MGTGSRTTLEAKDNKFKPGPGNYDSLTDLKRSSPKYGFGSQQRPQITGNNS
jgi:hypothetical protein